MKLTSQDILEYCGTLIIILTGIEPAAKAAAIVMPNWMSFTLAVIVMTLAAFQKQLQRKMEREAAEKAPQQQEELFTQLREMAELRNQIEQLRNQLSSLSQDKNKDEDKEKTNDEADIEISPYIRLTPSS